jgi:hypothetical protein
MVAPACTDEQFTKLFQELGSPTLVAQKLGMTDRAVMGRRRAVEARTGVKLASWNSLNPGYRDKDNHGRYHCSIKDGHVFIFSDAHYWPGIVSTAHRALVHFCKLVRPAIVINNGDSFDGASISRYPRIGWDDRPSVIQELEANTARLGEIEEASPNALRTWNLGNHCARMETRLAAAAPEFEGVKGFSLKDHFPSWIPAWATWINEEVVVKHRFKGGVYAARNNTLWAGKHIVTGHDHKGWYMPMSDYNGTRYGIDAGTLAKPYGAQFTDYTEDNPVDWQECFVILTFKDGRLMQPEHVRTVSDGVVEFRGELISVGTE